MISTAGRRNRDAGKISHLVPLQVRIVHNVINIKSCSFKLSPFQHLLWEGIRAPLKVWRMEATVSLPASSSFTPAPSPRVTASSVSRLVSSCSQMIRILPPLRLSQDHQLAAWLMNRGTQKLQALPRGREKCQKVSNPQLTTHTHFASAPDF